MKIDRLFFSLVEIYDSERDILVESARRYQFSFESNEIIRLCLRSVYISRVDGSAILLRVVLGLHSAIS